MKIFRFDAEGGQENEHFGSVKFIISKILDLEDKAEISSVYIRPNGKFGVHQTVTQRLFLLVEGEGWVRNEADEKYLVRGGQAIFLEKDEWHELGTETGMTAVIIEGVKIESAKLMPLLQEDGP